jgi:hypothetical protein
MIGRVVPKGFSMLDVVYVGLTLVLFGLTFLLIGVCERA